MPDDEWFAVLWIDAQTLAAAFNMEGAFNSVLLRLARGASRDAAVEALDRMLEPYGGFGAVGREDQMSHKILTQEINQQRIFGTVLPAIFLLVAAFILNVVLHRQVNAQRGEIAALKALGYDDRAIAWHYLKFASVIVLLGVVIGIAPRLVARAARMTGLYTDFFHFPAVPLPCRPWLVLAGAARRARSPPSAARSPPSAAWCGCTPPRRCARPRRRSSAPLLLERLGYAQLLTPAQRMIMRNLERKPVRAAITVAGIAGSVAILIAGTFWTDALEWFIDVQFNQVQRADVQRRLRRAGVAQRAPGARAPARRAARWR